MIQIDKQPKKKKKKTGTVDTYFISTTHLLSLLYPLPFLDWDLEVLSISRQNANAK